jgi:hypothetical protein
MMHVLEQETKLVHFVLIEIQTWQESPNSS